ncbi:hypothetical protein EXIGLDRAFT_743097 [Exidia glandulosa HHB12029]|uniref:Polysaccharide lyase 14 domain-containing protein n=1 Tax=Exidia glandulosa HHB12029 TaxID=1314781 RepID=A0A165AZ64_EXIGL|nr:hypothetical protein EXIGLDRAFT_743097 [Exidia glandulosa HHB12029]
MTTTLYDPSHLFPVRFAKAFTTSTYHFTAPNIDHVLLDDKALRVSRVASGFSRKIVTCPAGTPGPQAWEAIYPKDSYKPSASPRGGFSFYLAGPPASDSTTDFSFFAAAREVLFSYAVKFEHGFLFNKGGKLPGPCTLRLYSSPSFTSLRRCRRHLDGGADEEVACRCSGGRQEDRDRCFSLRLMWRADGAGEIYAYLPNVPENDVLLSIPGTVKDTSFGWSIARGSFFFAPGRWTVVAQRVKLNDVGSANGELELFVDGVSTIKASGLVISTHLDTCVRGAQMQTFFGGGSPDWASPQDQRAYFADISGAMLS